MNEEIVKLLQDIRTLLQPLESIEKRLRERFPTHMECQQIGKEISEMLMKRSKCDVSDESLQ